MVYNGLSWFDGLWIDDESCLSIVAMEADDGLMIGWICISDEWFICLVGMGRDGSMNGCFLMMMVYIC